MGRFIILMVGAVLFGSSYLLISGQRTTMETRDQQNDYFYQGIAREALESGFDRAKSAIKRDLMDVGTTFPRSTMDDGYYDLSIVKNSYGDLDVTVNAHSGDAVFDLQGKVIFTSPLPAAVLIDDDGVVVSGSGFYQISGVDRRMPAQGSGAGFDDSVRGIMSTETHLAEITGSLQMSQVVGIGTQPGDPVNQASVASGFSKADFEALYEEAKDAAHSVLGADPNGNVSQGSLISAVSSSSSTNPKIIRAMGNVSITGTLQGYGMLLIEDGDLVVSSPDFDWEGLIMLRKQFVDTVAISLSNTTLHGGLIAYDVDASGTTGCPADFDIVDNEAIGDVPFTVKVEVLGAAINSGSYDRPVTLRIHVGGQTFEPWGSYTQALNGNINTGDPAGTYFFDPEDVFSAGDGVSIDARSWKIVSGDGSEEDDWDLHKEVTSTMSTPRLELLEDGSSVPDVGGFEGQASVVEFIADYVDIESGIMTMDQNEAIYLFELGGNSNPNAASFDMQDAVVMITLIDAAGGCSVQGANSMFDVAINGGTQIHYSSEAIAKLGEYLATIRANTSVRVVQSSIQGRGRGETLLYEESVEADDQEEADPDPYGQTMYTVCHYGQDRSIPESALPAHIAHGDYMGSCQ